MRTRHIAIVLGTTVLAVAAVQAAAMSQSNEADEVRAVVEAAYIHGAFNEQDTAAMRAGFHPAFKIHGVSNGSLSEYPIDQWIESIEAAKARPDYEPETWTHRLPIIDVTGDAAVVKVELLHESRHVYTDYLSLLKLGDDWKITDKVYHQHPDS